MINQILQEIKKNKKYSTLADIVVKKEIQTYLKSNPQATLDKQTIKDIRAILHRNYSSFQTKKKNKIGKYLEELKELINNKKYINEVTKKLLSLTISTKERFDNYQSIYKQIFKITKKPKTILDLGSGLNIFSYPLMNLNNITYYGYDINEKDAKFLNKYLKIMKIKGKTKILDLEDSNKIRNLPKSDIVFLFKVVDLIKGKKYAEDILEILVKNYKHIVISFATRTISRKRMNYPYRKGFEIMLSRREWKFEKFQTDNEVFYIVLDNFKQQSSNN